MADIRKLFQNLKQAESTFFATTFLAPALKSARVQTRVAGILYTFRIVNAVVEGWGLFRPLSYKEAEFVQEAERENIERYFKMLPPLRVILAEQKENHWFACPVNFADAQRRLGITQVFLPMYFVHGMEQFEQAVARYDGAQLWFEDANMRRDLGVAAALREALQRKEKPEKVRIMTLTPEERTAYRLSYEALEKAEQLSTGERLKRALEHGGATLGSWIEQRENFIVRWTLNGQDFTSAIAKDEAMTTIVAGICVSGEDRKFDLASLPSVVREAQRKRMVHYTDVHDDPERYDYDDYYEDD